MFHVPPKLERFDDTSSVTDAVTLVACQVPSSNLVRDTRCLHVGSSLFFSLLPSKFRYSTLTLANFDSFYILFF
jgi:hypothetical protein